MKKNILYITTSLAVFCLSLVVANTASAAKVTATVIGQSDTEIDARVSALSSLLTRVGDIKHLSDSDKVSISTNIQAQITELGTLKTKIDADITSSSSLKDDFQSITKSYRIYALVIPQTRIIAAADRAIDISEALKAIGVKLGVRITAAQTAGKDVTSLQASLTDLNAKVADAETQAQAAITAVSALTPDNGDQTTMASNVTALKSARDLLKTAATDIKVARKDAGDILKAIKGFKLGGSVSASSTVSTASSTDQ